MTASAVPVRNWAGNLTYTSPRIHRPTDLGALAALVRDTPRIRALGSGHSFNQVADSPHDLVRLDMLPREVRIDGDTVTVSAGTRYADLAIELHRRGYALGNLASLPHISVAGSCATGTHGSGDRQRCLAAAVRGIEVMGSDGETVWVRRGAADFPGVVVGLGALGIVTRLTLEIEPTFEVSQRVRLDVPLDEVTADVDAIFGAAYSVSVFTDWRGPTGRVWLKHREGEPEGAWHGGRSASVPQHPVPGVPTEPATEQLGVPGPWCERLPHFRPELPPSAGAELQSELYLPRAAAPEAIAALRGLGERIAPVLYVGEVRTMRADDLWLSPAYGRDSVAFHFTWHRDPAAVTPVLRAVEERLAPLGARPHWGKITTMAPADVVGLFERSGDFAGLLERFDPDGTFRTPFVDAHFPRS
ncbi:D-arabinono-1,4-lactone oxidase [Nocardiopsis sp. MG754419]|uniref:D-arabinono-1,4-lactone oxidase n=1 Tax=Nocardiopsis sp. MG754419 TaxID=2259865 RepID=UPI001BAA190C|nr:D-arabinono-1,4-lactone oxidase [Nocardiopsis sp. MG754419]MBR8742219.1 FAD-binding protein [Nocardiopsis sp. MG754419]